MSDATIQRVMAIVRLVIPCAAGVAATFGWTLDVDLATNIIISALALIAFVWSWWKNNNVTGAAIQAQGVLDNIKRGKHEAE